MFMRTTGGSAAPAELDEKARRSDARRGGCSRGNYRGPKEGGLKIGRREGLNMSIVDNTIRYNQLLLTRKRCSQRRVRQR